MRLQNLIIIFIVLALPVLITLQLFVNYQVDTANLRAQYDSKLLGATYDMLQAFQLNSTADKYSTVSDSLIRDVEAAIAIFNKTFASSLGIAGQSQEQGLSAVPVLLFTLYDGYYIYMPSAVEKNGEIVYEHKLKPYVYYTKQYEFSNGNLMIINYSLDNYIAVYFYDKKNNTYTSKAGYLEQISSGGTDGIYEITNDHVTYFKNNIEITIPNEEIIVPSYNIGEFEEYKENLKRLNRNKSGDDNTLSAYRYYDEAEKFSRWFKEDVINANVNPSNNDDKEIQKKLLINSQNSALPEEQDSEFNAEKIQVIKNSITVNLLQALETYRRKSGVDAKYEMPQFSYSDWETILNNVCAIGFLEGFPIGTSTYNNYVILPNTANNQYTNEKGIYYVGYGAGSDDSYHRIGCEHLKGDTIVGYNRVDFLMKKRTYSYGDEYEYDIPHTACYYCVVSASSASIDETVKKYNTTYGSVQDLHKRKIDSYYTALAREKYNLAKLSAYIKQSELQNYLDNWNWVH